MALNIDTETENILKLLCFVILADGHIYAEEIDALSECSNTIGLMDKQGHPLSREVVQKWFYAQKTTLSESNSDTDRDIILTRLILKLADYPDKPKVVEALQSISAADGIIHREEKLMTSIVKAYWQHTSPGEAL